MANPGHAEEEVPPLAGGLADLYARDRAELREWIEDGLPRRLRESAAARHVLERQPVKMPACRPHIPGPEADLLVAYIRWLRGRQPFVDTRRTALLAFAVP